MTDYSKELPKTTLAEEEPIKELKKIGLGNDSNELIHSSDDFFTYLSNQDTFDITPNTKEAEEKQNSEVEENNSMSSFLENKGFIGREYWRPSINIGGKVVDITADHVFVECILDKTNKIFQIRKFNSLLFENIKNFNVGKLILIRIRAKAGSQRIDVIDANGMNMVKESDFEYIGEWEGIDNSLSEELVDKW